MGQAIKDAASDLRHRHSILQRDEWLPDPQGVPI